VEPTRSQNSTVSCRRSASGAGRTGAAGNTGTSSDGALAVSPVASVSSAGRLSVTTTRARLPVHSKPSPSISRASCLKTSSCRTWSRHGSSKPKSCLRLRYETRPSRWSRALTKSAYNRSTELWTTRWGAMRFSSLGRSVSASGARGEIRVETTADAGTETVSPVQTSPRPSSSTTCGCA
jgi:hypothetical protein